MLSPYAELHCASNFSFLRGASHAEELVERAKALGYGALAITDECSLAGVVRAHLAAKAAGLPLLVGAEFSLGHACPDVSGIAGESANPVATDAQAKAAAGPPTTTRLVLLAQTRNGYGNLSQLVTTARMRAAKGAYRLLREDLESGVDDCVALLVPPPALACDTEPLAQAAFTQHARFFRERFAGRCWVAVELLARGSDALLLERLRTLGKAVDLPLVAAGDVLFHVRSRKSLHDTLTAIRLNTPVKDLGFAIAPNAEQHLRSRLRLAQLYPAALLEETLEVASRCGFSLDELRYEYPEEIVPPAIRPPRGCAGSPTRAFPGAIRRDCRAGERQIEHELALIADLKYEPYFLTCWPKIVPFARSQGILCQGRGSVANSCWRVIAGITKSIWVRTERALRVLHQQGSDELS